MDGPLADFDRHFFKRCAESGWLMDCDYAGQVHRFATDHIPDKEHRRLAREMVDSTRWFYDLPVTPGSQEGLEELAQHAEVWVCTKPLEANATCRDDKAAWLARHFGEWWVKRLILAPDKSLVMGDVLLDDAPHPRWFQRAAWTPVIFPMSWNGPGSKWDGMCRWKWGDNIEHFAYYAREMAQWRDRRAS
jgi:5'-nucleotidase